MYMGERGNMKEKILSREAFSILRSGMQSEGKTVVLCHGVFDLLHYGHIEHLVEAKARGISLSSLSRRQNTSTRVREDLTLAMNSECTSSPVWNVWTMYFSAKR